MTSGSSKRTSARASLRERYPVLARIERPGRRRIPIVQQNTTSDCGAACMAMVLGWFGHQIRLDKVRDVMGAGQRGASALDLLKTAGLFGLRGRGISLDLDDLDILTPASILHWSFDHFVVFEAIEKDGIRILDPAAGRRKVSLGEFGKQFTGVALIFEKTEEFNPEKDGSKPILKYLRRMLMSSGLLLKIISLSFLLQVIGLGLPVLTGVMIDKIIPQGDLPLLQIMALGLTALTAFHFLALFIRTHLLIYLRTELDAHLTLDFLEHMFNLPFSFFQARSTGDLMMRLNSNSSVREILTSSALSAILDGSMVVLYLVLILWMNPLMGMVIVLLGFLRVLIFLATRQKTRDLMAENLAKQARSQSYQVQMFTGIETLKAVGAEPRALERFSHLFVDVLNVNLKRARLDAVIQSLIGVLNFSSPLVILFIGGHLVLQNQLSLGSMLALSALAGSFLMPVSAIVGTAIQFQQLPGYMDRIDDVLNTSKEQDLDQVTTVSSLKGGIKLENVWFSYSPNAEPVVSDATVDVRPGSMVAIVGRSGAGKTTLANLLLGLYRPTEGRIYYDGMDLTTLESRSVRSCMGVVVQQPHLFGATIRQNIALSDPDMPMSAVEAAARKALIHDDIMSMPMGYNTVLADGGLSLSGGQRQRIALARALIHDPAILLLDEATSSLDAVIEQQIQKTLQDMGCTRIVVAHRLSTIRNADVILAMDKGRIVESGTHDHLLTRKGVYYNLVSAQINSG